MGSHARASSGGASRRSGVRHRIGRGGGVFGCGGGGGNETARTSGLGGSGSSGRLAHEQCERGGSDDGRGRSGGRWTGSSAREQQRERGGSRGRWHATCGPQHKQQRARRWALMVCLRRQERRLHLGQPRTGQRRRRSWRERSAAPKRNLQWRPRRRRRRCECDRQDQRTGAL